MAGTGLLDADTTIGRHRLGADAHRQCDRAAGNAIGPLVTGAVMYPLRCGQIGAAGLALLTLALGPAIVRELLTPIGHSEELRTGNT